MIAMKGGAFIVPTQQKTSLWVIENMRTGQIYTFYEDLKRCDKAVESLRPLQCIPGKPNVSLVNRNNQIIIVFV
jgi:hypothetical protein